NRDRLGLPAEAVQFDSTIAATLRMLQQHTLDLKLEPRVLHGDTAYFDLVLKNKAGHKFPSGYPSRRAWVELEVKNAAGQTVFHSGRYNPDFSLPDEDANFEPHYNVISRPDQVQIYELVPGDVNGAFTNVLERGDQPLKDNRLTPQGFSLLDPVYDTTRIVGGASTDPDFNRAPDGTEGSGADVLHLHLPIGGYTGALTVSAKVWYQSLPPKWMAPMFAFSSPEIDSFRLMFNAADRSPVLVASAVLENVLVSPVSAPEAGWAGAVRVWPSMSADGRVWVELPEGVVLKKLRVWSAGGRLEREQTRLPVELPEQKGAYFIEILTDRGAVVRRVARM
ncbi:MAG: hypothetical protein JNK89_07850, partial [Saprospiraceae bacterium]|nr:hypothetical protein [Saprospiraceae bacterium]